MKKNEWIEWRTPQRIGPRLRVGDSVRVQYADGRTSLDTHKVDHVNWLNVKRYLVVEEPREAQLERERGELAAELVKQADDNTRLRIHVAALQQQLSDVGDLYRTARAEADELRECVSNLCGEIHAMTVAHMNTLTGLHAGIMRGIEHGELPADFYGRFFTTWAPKS